MKIVINSHINGKIALDHLLESMRSYKEYDDFEIIIIIGGYYKNNDYEIKKEDNITYIYCNHNSIDFTGLIALMELYPESTDHYFYLHDSCKIGGKFYQILKEIETNIQNITSMKINKNFSMNMGIYSQVIINKFKTFLLSKKNTEESKCMEFKINSNEDHIFNNDPNNFLFDNYNNWIHYGPVDYYKTGTMRIIEYYPTLDLYKIKANWGQGSWTLNN